MLKPEEFTKLYELIDEYLVSDACISAFSKKDGSGLDYTKLVICVDETISEEFLYPNPHKITDRCNNLNPIYDPNNSLLVIKDRKGAILERFKHFQIVAKK